MTQWLDPPYLEIDDPLQRAAGHPLVAQILARRGLDAPGAARAFLDPDAYQPAPPTDLPDLALAAARLRQARQQGERILVWGDFDVDGQTATTLLVDGLRQLGADVRAYIPQRLSEGHGIQVDALKRHLPGVDLLLTCDTGVSEHAAIDYARSQGVTVLVTDHHDLPPDLPPADALVDPKRLPPQHPLRELPGVGVAYLLLRELYHLSGGVSAEAAERHLDLVALGIVADVATQTGDTRYLLQRGMERLRRTERLGLQALMHIAKINPAHLNTDHIGFGLGPRLNALGRLGDANQAIELLTTDDLSRARVLAAQLEGLNNRRRLLTDQIYAAAQEQVAADPSLLDHQALVLSGPHWHPGVIGIVASRLAEAYARPTVLIAEGDDGIGRGSARSVPGVDIHAAITAADELLLGHGGHPGAAGLSLLVEQVPQFRRALSRAVDGIWDRSVAPGLMIDAYLPWSKPSLDLVDALAALAPFGEGNPHVTLASQRLSLESARLIGRDQAHRILKVRNGDGLSREVIWWRGAEHDLPAGVFDLAYQLKASDYRGERSLQIEYVDARTVEAPPTVIAQRTIQVIDQRNTPDPWATLAGLQGEEKEPVVWAEGYPAADSPGLRRDQLAPASILVIWSPPPGPRELQAALERVSPDQVHLFGLTHPGLQPRQFMRRLGGMVKHALRRKGGVLQVAEVAAALGARSEAVRLGVRLLAARGDLRLVEEGSGQIRLALDGESPPDPDRIAQIEAHLKALLAETAAYRAYFGRAPAESLV